MLDTKLLDIMEKCRVAKASKVIDVHVVWEDCSFVPVMSIIYNSRSSKSGQFCRTQFTRFDSTYSQFDYKISLNEFGNQMAFFKIDIQNEKWYQPDHQPNGVRIAVHPANIIPSDIESKFIKLMPGKSYVIEFSQIVSHLLPPPYQTKCYNYLAESSLTESSSAESYLTESSPTESSSKKCSPKKSPKKSPLKSRSDCIRACIFERAFDHERNCRRQWNVILINEIPDCEKLCPHDWYQDSLLLHTRNYCEGLCKADCLQEDYDVRMEINDDTNVDKFGNKTQVILRKQTLADKLIVHNADISFPSYVANVGGLAGIYLGLSVLTLYDHFIDFFTKINKIRLRLCQTLIINKSL